MLERPHDDRLDDFDARLALAKGAHAERTRFVDGQRKAGYGMAFAIAADLVGGLAGGAFLGWLVDRWLESAPFGMIAFFILGALAGMWNVFRTVRGYDMSLGFPATQDAKAERRDDTKPPADRRPADESGDQRGQSTPSIPGSEHHPD